MNSLGKRNNDVITLDVNTENDDSPFIAPYSSQRRKEHRSGNNNNGTEFASLLEEEQKDPLSVNTTSNHDFFDDDEEERLLASPLGITTKKNETRFFCLKRRQQANEKYNSSSINTATRYCCCCYLRKRTFFICIMILLSAIVSFIIFCSFYFSPAPLPTAIPMDKVLLLQQKNTLPPRVLTLNMFMRPPGIKNNENDFKNERLDYIVQNILPAYDIITIQEAFAYANRRIDTLLTAAFHQGFYYHVASARHYPWDLGGDGGLLILSRYPIVKSDRVEFPRGVHSDWLSYKGALHALIELNKQHSIHVYTTHTQASYDNAGAINFEDTKVRLSQFAVVHQLIKDTAKYDHFPILLIGDLNVDAAAHDSPTINVLSKNSSLAYTMMVDVLTGKGTDLELLIGSDGSGSNASSNVLSYKSDWQLDDLKDMAYSTFGHHPVTFGDYRKLKNGTLVPTETILTSHNQLMTAQSIDRIFWSNNNGSNHTASISLGNVSVEPFFVEKENGTNLPFTQISDHYGLSALLYL